MSGSLSARDLLANNIGKMSMIVRIPSPLRSYTKQKSELDVHGKTIDELLVNIDRQYPGIRFRMIDEQGRIRQHIKIFINTDEIHSLTGTIKSADVIHIICALSGG